MVVIPRTTALENIETHRDDPVKEARLVLLQRPPLMLRRRVCCLCRRNSFMHVEMAQVKDSTRFLLYCIVLYFEYIYYWLSRGIDSVSIMSGQL